MSASLSETSAQEQFLARDPATGAVLARLRITDPERIDGIVRDIA